MISSVTLLLFISLTYLCEGKPLYDQQTDAAIPEMARILCLGMTSTGKIDLCGPAGKNRATAAAAAKAAADKVASDERYSVV